LTGANSGGYFTWQFQTRNDATSCAINKINVNPEAATLNFIGQKLTLNSEALGAPDNCSPQGQKLNSRSLNWNWISSKPDVALLLNNGAYNVLPLANKGCNNQCLHTGSKPNVSVCGNGKVEKGESCDDGNIRNGDGCSSVCLNEGAAAPVCGNNIKDRGEDCDDGNVKSGDGCSDHCLSEGSPAGKSICGNSFISKGENCDDGNTVSGDGCSSQCLNEGSEPNIASCGNSIVETGEDCDDGNTVSGDGCSLACLNEGSIAGNAVCGNNVREKGENCDDGNTVSGDGCSGICLLEGSSINYAPPSICGDGATGKGENASCEAGGVSDANVDPRQYAAAVGKGNTKIQAAVNNIKGESSVEVLCVYTSDIQCAQFAKPGETLGAGADNCCYVKPQIIKTAPPENSIGICRNTLVGFTYDQIMDAASGLISIDEAKNGNCPAGSAPSADGLWCESAIKATRSSSDDKALGQTIFNFNIMSFLKSNTKYRIQTKDFKNLQSVSAANYGWIFATGANICKFEKIGYNPDGLIFNKVETKQIAAIAMTLDGEPIASIAGVYDWSWKWDADIKDSIAFNDASANPLNVTAKAKNGDGQLTTTAAIKNIPNDLKGSAPAAVFGAANATVFLCENPWLSITPEQNGFPVTPYIDTKVNFKTYYCRDTGNKETLLPYLSAADVAPAESDVLREILFTTPAGEAIGLRVYANPGHLSPLAWYKNKQFAGQPQASKVDGYEAIIDGRSAYINAANHVNPNYTNMFVISYNQGASLDLQNIYKQMMGNWRFNINLANIKLCKAAGSPCSSDLDCGANDFCQADKDKLTRDTKRLADFNDIAQNLEIYKSASASYPQVLSGSFLRGFSASVWPSWQAALGNDLGRALPTDPLNRLAACPSGYDSATCWNGATGQFVCPSGSRAYQYQNISQESYEFRADFEYNNGAGWSDIPANLKISGACAGIAQGTSAKCGDGIVGTGEECEKGNTATESCAINNRSGFRKLTCKADCAWDRTAVCGVGQCGDGIKQANEICDDGQNNGRYGYCNTACSGLSSFCGDGVKNGSEQCDLGVANGQYGSGCSWDCKTPGPSCGDKIINGGEYCDGNSENTKDAVSGLPACGIVGGYQTYRSRACQADCVWPAWSACQPAGACGNGVKEGTEQCDTGSGAGTAGSCVMDLAKGYACKTAVCGDGYAEAGKEACDQGSQNGQKCSAPPGQTCNYCGNACSIITITMPLCGNGAKEEGEACDAGAANGKIGGSCTADCKIPPVCGDGKIEGDEQCDVSAAGGFIWKFNNLTQSSAPSCSQLNWGGAGTVGCNKNSCKFYGGGCSDGPLSQGDVRVKLSWVDNDGNPINSNQDLDANLIVPALGRVYYNNSGTIFSSPYAWLAWDDIAGNRGPDINGDGKPDGLEIMSFTQHDSVYYPGIYKFYVNSYDPGCFSSSCSNIRVELYDFNHQNSPVRAYNLPSTQSGPYWSVFQMDGASGSITDINTVGSSQPQS
jgi:cysteine-rich repeat protein